MKALAVFSPILGVQQQYFIKSQIENVFPSNTVVLSIVTLSESHSTWSLDCPQLAVQSETSPADFPAIVGETETIYENLPRSCLNAFYSNGHQERIRNYLRDHGVDVILCQWMHESLPLFEMAQSLGARHFTQAHGTDITVGLNSASVRERYSAYNQTDGVISPSEFGRQQLHKLGLTTDKTFSVHHGVEVPESPPVKPRGRPVRCLIAGRMEPMKAPLVALDGFRQAYRKGADIVLDYAGDGSLRPEICEYLRQHKLENVVTLHGQLKHDSLLALMARSHILLHPSMHIDQNNRFDTCPVTVTEAMAQGVPVIATHHGGIVEEITDGLQGYLVAEGDSTTLGEKIVLLSNDDSLREDMGQRAWEKVRDEFGIPVIRAQMQQLLGLVDS
jgi:glycosyltransferase involved in cell wall biosynthesis